MFDAYPPNKGVKTGTIFGLISDIAMAAKIAKAAKACGLPVHNLDKAVSLLKCLETEKAVLFLIDWDGCEAEAYRLMEALKGREQISRIPVVGFVSKQKETLREEAQRAGCDRVYYKTEFIHELDIILARCAL